MLSAKESETAMRTFEMIDVHKTGYIDFEELGGLVRDVDERRTMMLILDADNNSTVSAEASDPHITKPQPQSKPTPNRIGMAPISHHKQSRKRF